LRNCRPRYQRRSLVSTVGHILRFGQVSVNCPRNAENVVCVNMSRVMVSTKNGVCVFQDVSHLQSQGNENNHVWQRNVR